MLAKETLLAHGGSLVLDRTMSLSEEEKTALLPHSIPLAPKEAADLELIALGALSPLRGFMGRKDYESVLESMRLENGIVFPLPVTLPLGKEMRLEDIKDRVGLRLGDEIVGVIEVEEVFRRDLEAEASRVFLTTDTAHPGVAQTLSENPWVAAGSVHADPTLFPRPFSPHHLTPFEARTLFAKKGWSTVVGFQTRNPIHRAHEYLIKCALENVDGAFIHPLVGATKSDDVPASVRMRCYEVLITEYFPENRALLGVFPAAMRYAGPREAVFHAICRKNYGCTHFIVGRDHAGVGSFYGTFDAQRMFAEFSATELGIEILKFDNAFYCTSCEAMATVKTCPHPIEAHVSLSGTKVREMLSRGEMPEKTFSRTEVARILVEAYRGMGS